MNKDLYFHVLVDRKCYRCDLNLREIRKQHGLTQIQLADRVGVSKNTISSIECGDFNPSLPLFISLCIALDCNFNDLIEINF